jgi:hypothetical protein
MQLDYQLEIIDLLTWNRKSLIHLQNLLKFILPVIYIK